MSDQSNTPRPTCGDCAHWHELPPDPTSGQTVRTGECRAVPPGMLLLPPRLIQEEGEIIPIGAGMRPPRFSPPIIQLRRLELPMTFGACDPPMFVPREGGSRRKSAGSALRRRRSSPPTIWHSGRSTPLRAALEDRVP